MSMPIAPLSPLSPALQPEHPASGPTAEEAADSLAAVQSQAQALDPAGSHSLDIERVRRLLADPL